MKNQKGITLIALIITIIVMLILVAVTLMITLGENGVIQKAREAKERNEEETLFEIAIGALDFNEDGTINKDLTLANLTAQGYTASISGDKLTMVGEHGTYQFKITGTELTKLGTVTPKNLTDLEKYILGDEGTGRPFEEIVDLESLSFHNNVSGDVDASNLAFCFVER